MEVSPFFYKYARGMIAITMCRFLVLFIYDMVLHFSFNGLSQVLLFFQVLYLLIKLDVLMFSVKVYRFLDLLYWVLCGCRVLLMLKLALQVVFEAFHRISDWILS